jgi:hypothetical protein
MQSLNSPLLIGICIALVVLCIAIVLRARALSRRDKWRVIPPPSSVVRTPSTTMVIKPPLASIARYGKAELPALLRE